MNNFPSDPSFSGELSICIRSLRAQTGGAEISVTVVIGSGERRETRTMVLTMEQYCSLNLKKGAITEEQFDAIEAASRLCAAIRCGESLLSYGANSAKMLASKILRHGFSKEEATAAAEYLCHTGLIDEARDLRREVEKCLRKLWGPTRIRTQLWNRGFGKEAMELLPELLEEIDFSENCARMLQKHYGGLPQDSAELRRITAALYRYGYSSEQIRAGIRRLQQDDPSAF